MSRGCIPSARSSSSLASATQLSCSSSLPRYRWKRKSSPSNAAADGRSESGSWLSTLSTTAGSVAHFSRVRGGHGLFERETPLVQGAADDRAGDLGMARERSQMIQRADTAAGDHRHAAVPGQPGSLFDVRADLHAVAFDVRVENG